MINKNFVGISHGLPDNHRQCSSTFITVGGNTYIIDAGTINAKLLETNTDYLIMTHVYPRSDDGLKKLGPPFKYKIVVDGDIVEI